ncbi:hypothetical protein [Novosphingobium sp. FKTRR1]|uniref:hypothetical protein n=1 Tax=unclassified Novosphingobium TaxID=2644732 RepID=UPI001CF01B82|nr:hypothetical protein [Novosphingobium sp. FKTRR1]
MDRLEQTPQDSRYAAPRRGRGVAMALSLAVCLLLGAALISMGAFQPPAGGRGATLVAVSIAGPKGDKADKPAPEHKQTATHATSQTATAQAAARPMPRVVVPSPNKVEWPEGFIPMSHADYASADIGKVKSAAGAGAQSADAGGGKGGGDGPGGAHLYNAEWYREPTDAQLSGYMHGGSPPGSWAMIACRTLPQYHVEDCQELDESPRGSGMARALRQAAWQFLVRPPRMDGKPMIGAWVRIRFDFTKAKRGEDSGPGDGSG